MRGMFKSSRLKKKELRVPGGRLKTHFRETRPKQARCGACGAPLHGIPRFRPVEAANAPKSQKRPERPYGGVLCGRCMKNMIAMDMILSENETDEMMSDEE